MISLGLFAYKQLSDPYQYRVPVVSKDLQDHLENLAKG